MDGLANEILAVMFSFSSVSDWATYHSVSQRAHRVAALAGAFPPALAWSCPPHRAETEGPGEHSLIKPLSRFGRHPTLGVQVAGLLTQEGSLTEDSLSHRIRPAN
jgi:hypothetical protein